MSREKPFVSASSQRGLFTNRKGSNNPVQIVMPQNLQKIDISSRNQYIPQGAQSTSSMAKATTKSFIQPQKPGMPKVATTVKSTSPYKIMMPGTEHSKSFVAAAPSLEQKKFSPLIERNRGKVFNPSTNQKRREKNFVKRDNSKESRMQYMRNEIRQNAEYLRNQTNGDTTVNSNASAGSISSSNPQKNLALSKYFKGQISYSELNQMKKQQLSSIITYLKSSQEKVQLPNFGQQQYPDVIVEDEGGNIENTFIGSEETDPSGQPMQIVEVVDIIDDDCQINNDASEMYTDLKQMSHSVGCPAASTQQDSCPPGGKKQKNQFSFGQIAPNFYQDQVNFAIQPIITNLESCDIQLVQPSSKKQKTLKMDKKPAFMEENRLHLSNSSDAFTYLTRQMDSLAMTPNFLKSPSHGSMASKQYEEMVAQAQVAKGMKLSQSSDEITKAVNIFFENKQVIGETHSVPRLPAKETASHNGNNINFIFYQPTHVIDKRKVFSQNQQQQQQQQSHLQQQQHTLNGHQQQHQIMGVGGSVPQLKTKFKIPRIGKREPPSQNYPIQQIRSTSAADRQAQDQQRQKISQYYGGKRDENIVARKNKRLLGK